MTDYSPDFHRSSRTAQTTDHAFSETLKQLVKSGNADAALVSQALRYADRLKIDEGGPGRNVNLHDTDSLSPGNCEGVPTAFDQQDTGHQERIRVVLPCAGHDGFRSPPSVP